MGFRFRKSFGKGPFRVTISKSGVSTSIGGKGARFTKKANGNTMSTFGIPNSGITYVSETSNEKKGNKRMNNTKLASSNSNKNEEVKKIKKPLWKRFWIWLLIIICFFVSCSANSSNEAEVVEVKTFEEVEETEETEEVVEDFTFEENESQENLIIEEEETVIEEVIVEDTTKYVYITKHGEKYHDSGCRHIKDKEVSIISEQEAILKYEPCGTCGG